jgi:hypothetical protein
MKVYPVGNFSIYSGYDRAKCSRAGTVSAKRAPIVADRRSSGIPQTGG